MLSTALPEVPPIDSSEKSALEAALGDPEQLDQDSASQPKVVGFWAAVAFSFACVLCDFLLVPAFMQVANGRLEPAEAVCCFVMLGCTLAQGNLLATWLAWSEGPFVRRLVIHWLVASGLYGVWRLSLASIAVREDSTTVAVIVLLAVPLVSVAAQIPPWLMRQWLGWRLVRASGGADFSGEQPLTIRGLMSATVVVAVSLALARLMPTVQPAEKEYWLGWMVAFAVTAAISTMGMLPAGRVLLGFQQWRLAVAVSSFYAAALIGLVWIIREIVIRYAWNSGPPIFAYVFLSSLMVGYAVTVIAAGSVARGMGYRLVRGRWLTS